MLEKTQQITYMSHDTDGHVLKDILGTLPFKGHIIKS